MTLSKNYRDSKIRTYVILTLLDFVESCLKLSKSALIFFNRFYVINFNFYKLFCFYAGIELSKLIIFRALNSFTSSLIRVLSYLRFWVLLSFLRAFISFLSYMSIFLLLSKGCKFSLFSICQPIKYSEKCSPFNLWATCELVICFKFYSNSRSVF